MEIRIGPEINLGSDDALHELLWLECGETAVAHLQAQRLHTLDKEALEVRSRLPAHYLALYLIVVQQAGAMCLDDSSTYTAPCNWNLLHPGGDAVQSSVTLSLIYNVSIMW